MITADVPHEVQQGSTHLKWTAARVNVDLPCRLVSGNPSLQAAVLSRLPDINIKSVETRLHDLGKLASFLDYIRT